MWCYLEKINSIVPGCVCASGKKGFSPDMKTTATWCQINEKVSFCSFKQWAGPAQRHVYSCICCLKIKTQPELKKKKKNPKRDAKELRPVFIHSGALWLLGRWTQVDNHTVCWQQWINRLSWKYHHLVFCFWLCFLPLRSTSSHYLSGTLLFFIFVISCVNLLFSLPQLFWTYSMRWEWTFLRVSVYKNTWCSTYWSLFFFNALSSSWSLCGFVLCGPRVIRLSGCWPCK